MQHLESVRSLAMEDVEGTVTSLRVWMNAKEYAVSKTTVAM